jgi:hypothetical protein
VGTNIPPWWPQDTSSKAQGGIQKKIRRRHWRQVPHGECAPPPTPGSTGFARRRICAANTARSVQTRAAKDARPHFLASFQAGPLRSRPLRRDARAHELRLPVGRDSSSGPYGAARRRCSNVAPLSLPSQKYGSIFSPPARGCWGSIRTRCTSSPRTRSFPAGSFWGAIQRLFFDVRYARPSAVAQRHIGAACWLVTSRLYNLRRNLKGQTVLLLIAGFPLLLQVRPRPSAGLLMGHL